VLGTVVEYDEAGKLVWTWNSSTYFDSIDLSPYKHANGMLDRDVHENSFYFDEKKSELFVSFRDVGTIVKVAYPSGKVLDAYGKLEGTGDRMPGHFFCGQHSCKISRSGNLYVYNNGCTPKAIPSVVMMQLPATGKDTLRKIWEFMCPVDYTPEEIAQSQNPQALERSLFSAGGNVMELADSSIFVSTNTNFSKIFIVTRDKKMLWIAKVEKWFQDLGDWKPFPMYRATIIPDPRELERVIWNTKAEAVKAN
jgi:Arylsulfotransferase (ASST)